MVKLTVCVGSACHLKGAHEVVDVFQSLIAEMELQSSVELLAGFCLGHCTEAVTCRVGEELMLSVTPSNAREKFLSAVLPIAVGEGLAKAT